MKTYQNLLSISLYNVENKKEKIADFKTAISSTVRSLSNSEKIEVSFGNDNSKSGTNLIRLPELSSINNKLNYICSETLTKKLSFVEGLSGKNIFEEEGLKYSIEKLN